jgi:Holliday junction resolvase RusA-like endonuclease
MMGITLLRMQFTVPGNPRTKKNSQIVVNHIPIPSKAYRDYARDTAVWWKHQAAVLRKPIDYPVNVQCVYYMQTRRKCDLTNLLECSDDIMVQYGILQDDNCSIVAGHDGSRVLYDKDNPRVEITITRIEG